MVGHEHPQKEKEPRGSVGGGVFLLELASLQTLMGLLC